MDDLTKKEIGEYLGKLPVGILNVIEDKTWPKRVEEIATKYSLNEEQGIVLQNLVLFVIIGVEEAETFGESLEQELGVSKLLVEQIIKDVDERVFKYVFNFISEENQKSPLKTPEPEMPNRASGTEQMEENIPEIRPEISPMVEKGENVKVNPIHQVTKEVPRYVPENLPGIEISKVDTGDKRIEKSEKIQENKIENTPKYETMIGSEFIQRPISVPRFENRPEPEIQKVEVPKTRTIPQNMLEAKLNSVVAAPKEEVKKAPTSYTVDPYREPLE